MNDVSLHQFLVLYTWFPLAVFLSLVLLIARFYQKFSGERTHYGLFAVCILGFGIILVRFASIGISVGDFFADALSFLMGVLLLFLVLRLYKYMMLNEDDAS